MPEPFVAVPSYAVTPHPAQADAPRHARGDPAAAADVPALADVSALGTLAGYAASGLVTDLFVNGESGLWLDAGRGLLREPGWQCDERSLRELAVRLIALGGRHIDEASPCVDVRLADGIRVHAVLPPVSSCGTLLFYPPAQRPAPQPRGARQRRPVRGG